METEATATDRSERRTGPLRIAMWSGPRNVSTALLRAWENRGDTAVCDEPLYSHYLRATGLPHPGAEEVIASQESDWRRVVAALTGDVPAGQPIYYQKHMAHHLLPEMGREWLDSLTHCFLIRSPFEMLLSLDKITPEPRLEDTGLPQQVEIFEGERRRSGRIPPVVDARDLLEDPPGVLAALCRELGVEFTEKMLSWPPGSRPSDGVWAKHWYDSVEKTTGFQPYRRRTGELSAHLHSLLEESEPYYRSLYAHRIRAA